MTFGDVAIGESAAQTGTLTASSNDVRVSSVAWNGQYSVSDISLPTTVTAGESLSYTVTFAPDAIGNAPGSISFHSDASNPVSTGTLTGTGVQAVIQTLPASSSIPVYGVQSITALMDGLTYAAPVWTNDCGLSAIGFGTTTGWQSTTQRTCHVTATVGSVSATSTISWTPPQVPSTAHPRILFNSSDLATLENYMISSNQIWTNGLQAGANAAKNFADPKWNYSAACDGTGMPTANWLENGNPGNYAQYATEQYAMLFAFMSMVDPAGSSARHTWGCHAKDMILWELGLIAASSAPFTSSSFGVSNRAENAGEAFGAAVDWLQAGGFLSSTQLQTIVAPAFRVLVQRNIAIGITSGDNMLPLGSANYNSTALLTSNNTFGQPYQFLWATNNYYAGHAKMLISLGLALDATNDPVQNVDGQTDPMYVSTSGVPNSVRAGINNFLGGRLYQEYAVWEDKDIVANVLNGGTAIAYMGIGNGGYPPEGYEYGVTFGYCLQGLYIAYKAGVLNLQTYPQGSLLWSSEWARANLGLAESMYYTYSGNDPGYGQYWQLFGYGSMGNPGLLFNVDWGRFPETEYLIPGSSAQDQTFSQWFGYNALLGGPSTFYNRFTNVGSSFFTDTILYFAMYAPEFGTTSPSSISDPRLGYPLRFIAGDENKDYGVLTARTDWTANASVFNLRCPYNRQDHTEGRCGQIDYYRKGEEMLHYAVGYDIGNGGIENCKSLNVLCLVNTNTSCSSYDAPICSQGGQYYLGQQSADPTVRLFSYGTNYAFGHFEMTGLYNATYLGGNAVTHASRTTLWISPDLIIDYLRGTTGITALPKSITYSVTRPPTIAGNLAKVVTAHSQNTYIQSLLPSSVTVTSSSIASLYSPSTITSFDPSTTFVTFTPSSNIADARFLNVIQGGDSGSTQTVPALVQSSAGTNFDGAVIGSNAVLFKRTISDSFSSITFTVPNTVAQFYVANLTPNGGYTTVVSGSGTNYSVTVTSGGSLTADAAGVLSFAH